MKKLINIVFIFGILFLGSLSLQAKEVKLLNKTNNDYRVLMKTLYPLKIGKNDINIKIKHKEHVVHGADVILKVYQPDKKIIKYNVSSTNNKGTYLISIDLPKKGNYQYILFVSKKAGVKRTFRGKFSI